MAQKAVELARRELEPKPSLPFALEQMGWVLLYREKHQEASEAAEEAVRRNPNYADGYALWAHVLIYLGKPEEALDKSQEAINRNPKYPFFYDYHRGQAYYVWGFLTSAQTLTPAGNILRRPRNTFGRPSGRTTILGRPARTSWLSSVSLVGRMRR